MRRQLILKIRRTARNVSNRTPPVPFPRFARSVQNRSSGSYGCGLWLGIWKPVSEQRIESEASEDQ